MKRASTLWTLLSGLLLGLPALFTPASAMVSDNPYGGIVERNAFALKPPTPPVVAAPPPAPPAGVELRGITTLLGRPQVLLNFKVPGRPPEPPKDRSLVMDVGQREGDVEVLEINPDNGTVRFRNQGNEVSMNLKDNAPKPQFTASAGVPGMPPAMGAVPSLPAAPGAIPAPAPAPAPSTFSPNPGTGATPAARPALPSRNLRSGGEAAVQASAVQQAALMEIERERTADLVKQGKMPPLPPMPFSHKEAEVKQ